MDILDTTPQTWLAKKGVQFALWLVGVLFLIGLGGYIVFGIMGYKLGKQQQKTETKTDQVVATQQEQKGQADVQAREDTLRIVVDQARGAARDFAVQAQRAPDARIPLAAERVARLHDADRQLCAFRPAICEGRADGGSAPVGDAEAGPGDVPLAAPPGQP